MWKFVVAVSVLDKTKQKSSDQRDVIDTVTESVLVCYWHGHKILFFFISLRERKSTHTHKWSLNFRFIFHIISDARVRIIDIWLINCVDFLVSWVALEGADLSSVFLDPGWKMSLMVEFLVGKWHCHVWTSIYPLTCWSPSVSTLTYQNLWFFCFYYNVETSVYLLTFWNLFFSIIMLESLFFYYHVRTSFFSINIWNLLLSINMLKVSLLSRWNLRFCGILLESLFLH